MDLANISGAYQSEKSLVSSNKILLLYSLTLYNLFLKFFTFLSLINCILFKIFTIFLKIIGIFMRLAVRDNKKKYLKLIPYAWELINHRIKEKNEFNNLMLLLKNNFPKFIR